MVDQLLLRPSLNLLQTLNSTQRRRDRRPQLN